MVVGFEEVCMMDINLLQPKPNFQRPFPSYLCGQVWAFAVFVCVESVSEEDAGLSKHLLESWMAAMELGEIRRDGRPDQDEEREEAARFADFFNDRPPAPSWLKLVPLCLSALVGIILMYIGGSKQAFCPAEPLLPAFLTAVGTSVLLSCILRVLFVLSFGSFFSETLGLEASRSVRLAIRFFLWVVHIFALGWHLLATWLVISSWKPDLVQQNSDRYCDRTVFNASVLLVFLFYASFLIALCCLPCLICCFGIAKIIQIIKAIITVQVDEKPNVNNEQP